jgi:hypothetical protein
MLNNPIWNFKTIEKITTAFGYIFNDVSFERINPNTGEVQTIKVPIDQAAKEKWSVRELEDPHAGDEERQRHVQIILPRMAYELTQMHYDPKRKLSSINYRVAPSGNGPYALVQLNPVPQLMDFSLYLQTRTISDRNAIVEQVIAFFRPDYVVPIIDIPEMNIKRDIVVTLMNSTLDDSYQGNFQDKRTMGWQFDFQVQGHIYQPIKMRPVITDSKIYMDQEALGDNNANVDVQASPNTGEINATYDIVVSENNG